MPALEVSDLRQRAVLWPLTGRNRFAEPTVDLNNPVEIPVRWMDVRKEMLDQHGQTVAIDAQAVVAVDIAVGSLMWLGRVTDLTGTTPLPSQNVMQVIGSNSTPDIKNRNVRRTVNLMRYGDAIPQAS